MLVIRFLRVGKKNQPVFKIVVTDKKNPPRGGRFVEQVGFYNPLTKEKNLKAERIKYWLSVGTQLSDTVHNLLVSEKIIEGKKIPVHKTKKGSPAASTSVETSADKKTMEDKKEAKAPEKPVEETAKEETKEEQIAEEKTTRAPLEEKPEEAPQELSAS